LTILVSFEHFSHSGYFSQKVVYAREGYFCPTVKREKERISRTLGNSPRERKGREINPREAEGLTNSETGIKEASSPAQGPWEAHY